MKIIQAGNNKYIDQDLKTYIDNIWLSYDIEIAEDSNIFFTKNTTVNRLITDYAGKGISRVIKKTKAEYVIINKFNLTNFPQYFDGFNITEDDTKEVVYGIYNQSIEVQDTIQLILDFILTKQEVKYVNQDKLNDSLNNGFILDKDNYVTIKELVDSPHADNHQLAINMLVNSDLKQNMEWIIYLYYKKFDRISSFDKKDIVVKYFNTLNTGSNLSGVLNKIDACLHFVKTPEIKERFIYLIKSEFQNNINDYFSKTLGTGKFELEDFKIKYNGQ